MGCEWVQHTLYADPTAKAVFRGCNGPRTYPWGCCDFCREGFGLTPDRSCKTSRAQLYMRKPYTDKDMLKRSLKQQASHHRSHCPCSISVRDNCLAFGTWESIRRCRSRHQLLGTDWYLPALELCKACATARKLCTGAGALKAPVRPHTPQLRHTATFAQAGVSPGCADSRQQC